MGVACLSLGSNVDAEANLRAAVAALRERLGLDEPLLSQFTGVLGRALQGDLGTSLVSRTQTVTDIAVPAFINTIGLVAVALAISVITGK